MKRSRPHSWLGTRQQTVSGQQASPGSQRCYVHGDGPPVSKGSAAFQYCYFSMICGAEKLPVLAWTPSDIHLFLEGVSAQGGGV